MTLLMLFVLLAGARALMGVTGITAGQDHSCGLTEAGIVFCWGRNDAGQLGDSSVVGRLTPVRARGTATFASVSAGFAHTCALTASGQAMCWGSNVQGRLCDGTTTNRCGADGRERRHHVRLRAGRRHAQLRPDVLGRRVLLGAERQRTARRRTRWTFAPCPRSWPADSRSRRSRSVPITPAVSRPPGPPSAGD